MTIVYFHAADGRTAELHGAERGRMANLVRRATEAMLDLRTSYQGELLQSCQHLRRFVDPSHYLVQRPLPVEVDRSEDDAGQGDGLERFARSFLDCLAIGSDFLQWRGRPIDSHALSLNTAIAIGSDEIRLAARLDAQCEIHGWVDGPNRAWLAGLVESGLASGLLRASLEGFDLGWRGVVDLLRAASDGCVVTSFSVSDRFPSSYIACVDAEAFDEMSHAEQWTLAVRALREGAHGRLLELRPDDWATYRFDHGLSALDLVAEDWESRLDARLGREAS